MVFAVVSSDTSSPFHVYVSLFGCDDWAMPGTGPVIVNAIVKNAICIQCVAMGSSFFRASYALSGRSLLMVPAGFTQRQRGCSQALRFDGSRCGDAELSVVAIQQPQLRDQGGFDLPAMKHN